MSRILITDAFPSRPAEILPDVLVLTPHARVARAIGAPSRNLQTCAKEALKKSGFGIATPTMAALALKRSAGEVVAGADAAETARHYREIVGATLRSCGDVRKLESVGSGRAKTLARIVRRYVELLERERLVDSEAALATAVKLGIIEPRKVLIYGYFRARQLPARPEEIEYIDKFAADGSVFYLPCPEGALFRVNREWRDRLLRSGWEIAEPAQSNNVKTTGQMLAARFADMHEDHKADPQGLLPFETNGHPIDAADVTPILYSNIEAEVRGILGSVKQAVRGGTSPDEIAIVCRNPDEYVHLISAIAGEYHLPVDIEHAIPLAKTELGKFISLLIEAKMPRERTSDSKGEIEIERGAFEYEPTVRLLRHPFGPGLADETWAEARKKHPHGFDEWTKIGAGLDRMASPAEQSGTGWASWLRAVISDRDVRSQAGKSAAEMLAFNTLMDAISELSQHAGDKPKRFEHFAVDIFDVMNEIKTPFCPSAGGVTFCQPNTIVGDEFEEVFVMGMAEGIFPEAATDDPIVDFYDRKELATKGVVLQDALEVPRWEALSFYFTLLSAARKITLSYPRYVDSEERLESPFFKRLGLKPKRAAQIHLSSIREMRRAFLNDRSYGGDDPLITSVRHQFAVEEGRESAEQFGEYDGVLGVPFPASARTWSVSQLTRFGQCPFKWFADKVFRLRVPDEAESDLAANKRGSLYHKTLEIAVRATMNSADIRAAILEKLEEFFAEAEATGEFALTLVANWELRRDEHLDTLRKVVTSNAFIAPNAQVFEVEQDFLVTWNGLKLSGKIDRIDRTPAGLSAVDYKTSNYRSRVKDEFGKLKIDIQLPIYSKVALRQMHPGEQIASGRYISLGECKADDERDAAIDEFADRVKEMLARGWFAVEPDVDGTACTYCEYDGVCRRGPRLARKSAAT